MKKIKWYYHSMTKEDKRSGIVEVPDGFTNEEIEEEVWGIVREFFEWGWWKLRPGENESEGEGE